jgi:glutathione S-transferase
MTHAQLIASSITLLTLIQFTFFGALVAKARVALAVPAPLTAGSEAFERINRVHLNTLERLALFLPLLWMATLHTPGLWLAPVGILFFAGRLAYWRGYVREPAARKAGNIMSMITIAALLVLNIVGLVRSLA